jgi:hypothetical protein
MNRVRRVIAVGIGAVALLLGIVWVFDSFVPKSPEVAVWKERCAGWRVRGTYFTDDATEFYHAGESQLIPCGQPFEFGFGYGGQFVGLGKPINTPGHEPVADVGVERDTLVVKLLKDTHQDGYRYQLAVVVLER